MITTVKHKHYPFNNCDDCFFPYIIYIYIYYPLKVIALQECIARKFHSCDFCIQNLFTKKRNVRLQENVKMGVNNANCMSLFN